MERFSNLHQCTFQPLKVENLPICSCSYKNIYPGYFAFLILRAFELFTRKVCKMFVYKHTETIDYVKK